MFFMKTKKRVKILEEQYEQMENKQRSVFDDLSDLKFAVSDIENKLVFILKPKSSNGTGDSDLKDSIMKLKGYIDSQIDLNKKSQLSENDVSKMLNENNTQIIAKLNSTVEQLKERSEVNIDYNRLNQQIVLAVLSAD